MYVSLRSTLTAGTVAVMGAGAIALAPVAPTEFPTAALVVPSAAEVALTGISLPFDIVGVLQNLGIGGALPDIVDALPSLLPNDLVTAVLNEFAAQAGPLLIAAAGEVFGYLGTTVSTLISTIPQQIGAAVVAIPGVLASAVQSASAGDFPAALQTLYTGILAPITSVTQAIQEASDNFQAFIADQINTLGSQIPGVLFASIQAAVGGNFQSVLDAVQEALAGLFGGLNPAAALPAAAVRSGAATVPARVSVPVAGQPIPRAGAAVSAEPAAVATPAAVAEVDVEAPTVSATSEKVTESAHPRARVARQATRPVVAAVPDTAVADSAVESAAPAPKAAGRSSAAKRSVAAASDSAPAEGR